MLSIFRRLASESVSLLIYCPLRYSCPNSARRGHVHKFAFLHIGVSTLTALNLEGCSLVTDVGLAELRHAHLLTDLSLVNCKEVSDHGVRSLVGKPLARLCLAGCEGVTPEVLDILVDMPLVDLVLSGWDSDYPPNFVRWFLEQVPTIEAMIVYQPDWMDSEYDQLCITWSGLAGGGIFQF